jgi:hypothetical protein
MPVPSLFLKCLVFAGLFCGLRPFAQAKPAYAQKEGKPCQFCHVSSSPGMIHPTTKQRESTLRNERGLYYARNNYSLQGYVETRSEGRFAVPKATTKLALKFLWKQDFTDLPRRIAVADVIGDGKPRLIMLHEKPEKKDAALLTVRKWDGKAYVTEFQAEVQASADRMQVGKFAGKDKPAVILTADALWHWNGTTFARKPSTQHLPLFGTTRLRDGTEMALLAERPDGVRAHRVYLDRESWLSVGSDPPNSSTVRWGDMHATPEFFELMGLEAFGAGGLIGVWDAQETGKPMLYYARIDADVEIDPASRNQKTRDPKFILRNKMYFVTVRDPNSTFGAELWTSPELPGLAFDIALENAQGDGKAGILMLIAEREKGKPRTLAFFALE